MKQIATCSLAFIFLFVTFIGPGTAKASDKAVRFAIVKEWKGSVTVTKSGGDKALQVFNKMSINQGDRIETGPKSSVVLQLAGNDEEDELTIGADADVSFTELKIKDGVKTRIGVLAGSVFTKVKSLTGADDRFELETPTAVMAVRGTQFGVYVHPRLGWTQLHVIAGVVQAQYPVASESGGKDRLTADGTSTSAAVNNQGKITQKEAKGDAAFVTFEHQFVYPAQSATFIPARGRGIEALYEYANIEAVLTELDPAILRSMVTGYADAAKENDQYVKAWQKDGCAIDYSGLVHKSCEILRSFSRLDGDTVSIQAAENEQSFEIRVVHNMKVYLAALVRVAVDSGMLTRKEADASRIPWREATLQISETERQQQHWVLKRLEKWISGQKRVNPHDSSITSAGCKQKVNGIESQVLDELEWKYANSLSPSERIRFIENLKVAQLELCKNTYEYLVCCESSSSVADGSLGNRDGDIITPNPDPDPKPDPDPDPDPKPDPEPDPDPKPDPDPDPDPKPDPDPDPDPKPDPDPEPDPKPDPDPDPDPKPDPDPDPDPKPDPEPDPDPKPDPDPDPDPKPDPDPDPDPKPDPDPDPDPKPDPDPDPDPKPDPDPDPDPKPDPDPDPDPKPDPDPDPDPKPDPDPDPDPKPDPDPDPKPDPDPDPDPKPEPDPDPDPKPDPDPDPDPKPDPDPDPDPKPDPDPDPDPKPDPDPDPDPKPDPDPDPDPKPDPDPDPDPKPDPDPDPDPKPDPDPDPDPKPDPDPDPEPKPDPDPDPDPKPDPEPDPDPKPDPDPDPDPKPDPDPDPDPQPQAHVFEIASSVDHVAPNSRLVVDMVLKRLKTKLNVVAVEFTVEISGGTLDSVELNDDKAVYRHGGSKFVIAHHPNDYDKSNSVDSITVSGNRFVYRLVVTTPETVSLESDDQILSLPYIAGESGTMSLKLSEVRFYDATGALLELNTMDQPLEIMVNP
ncbi:FecR domain-containing protein [Paenibacillus sp. MER TA 81-3]|uniref:FecR domain-containing protein n=1 Tax=Paenibacillus sp. MER TA 81-3 TaxID=2939573 RepID=UPI00203B8776|nr:FecR domain-containing protein [Paenibacillus sp. MER TA 81-3]MCM3340372.1 FecR domain-containing protein [Paenibacillus sp. MER TA 81-3]